MSVTRKQIENLGFKLDKEFEGVMNYLIYRGGEKGIRYSLMHDTDLDCFSMRARSRKGETSILFRMIEIKEVNFLRELCLRIPLLGRVILKNPQV